MIRATDRELGRPQLLTCKVVESETRSFDPGGLGRIG